jgi:hypothetical protein
MEKLVLGVLAGEAVGRVEEVARMEVEVDRLYWLVVRQLLLAASNRSIAAKVGVTEPRHLLGDRVISVTLENVGDLWEEMAVEIGFALRSGQKPSKEIAKTIAGLKSRLEKIIELTMTSFFAFDLKKANESLDLQMALVQELQKLGGPAAKARGDRPKGAASQWLGIVLRPLEHVIKYYGTIAQVTVNRVLESPLRPRPVPAEPPAEGVPAE